MVEAFTEGVDLGRLGVGWWSAGLGRGGGLVVDGPAVAVGEVEAEGLVGVADHVQSAVVDGVVAGVAHGDEFAANGQVCPSGQSPDSMAMSGIAKSDSSVAASKDSIRLRWLRSSSAIALVVTLPVRIPTTVGPVDEVVDVEPAGALAPRDATVVRVAVEYQASSPVGHDA